MYIDLNIETFSSTISLPFELGELQLSVMYCAFLGSRIRQQ